MRWASEVQQNRLTIEHLKARANTVADILSHGLSAAAEAADSEWPIELRAHSNMKQWYRH